MCRWPRSATAPSAGFQETLLLFEKPRSGGEKPQGNNYRVQQMIDAGNASGPRLSAVAQRLKRENVTAVNNKMGTKGGNISKSLRTKYISGGFLFSTLFSALDLQIWKKTLQKGLELPTLRGGCSGSSWPHVKCWHLQRRGGQFAVLTFLSPYPQQYLSGTFSVDGNWVRPGVPSDSVPRSLNS